MIRKEEKKELFLKLLTLSTFVLFSYFLNISQFPFMEMFGIFYWPLILAGLLLLGPVNFIYTILDIKKLLFAYLKLLIIYILLSFTYFLLSVIIVIALHYLCPKEEIYDYLNLILAIVVYITLGPGAILLTIFPAMLCQQRYGIAHISEIAYNGLLLYFIPSFMIVLIYKLKIPDKKPYVLMKYFIIAVIWLMSSFVGFFLLIFCD
jgi:hypothetical protein